MIRSFGDRRTRRFFEGQRVAAFQRFAEQATRRLTLLDSAATLQDLAALPRAIGSKPYAGTGPATTASGLTRSGGSANFGGKRTGHTT